MNAAARLKNWLGSRLGFWELFALALLLVLAQRWQVALFWSRNAIGQGDWVRLWTGHWVHWDGVHLAFNIIALLLLPWVVERPPRWLFYALWFLLPPILSSLFYWFLPGLHSYAGLSGVLHGLFMAAALWAWQFGKDKHWSILLAVLILAKLLQEHLSGSSVSSGLMSQPVLTEAHAWAVGCVLVIWGIFLVFDFAKKTFKTHLLHD